MIKGSATTIGTLVETKCGSLRGAADDAETWSWKGIPYAAAPVGELRWKAPREPEPWDGVRDATQYGPVCRHFDALTGKIRGDGEDCLNLNVWRPRSDQTGLPVYFWIHGGGNSFQMPSLEETCGARLAARSNVVVVSINYRLGEFGWFAHPALRSGRPGDEMDDSGNFGTLDILQALKWVQANIEAFGGDPNNVFVTGESAGGFNTLSLLISPAAKGLYHKGMSQSGRQNTAPMAEAEAFAETYLPSLLFNEGKAADEAEALAVAQRMTNDEVAAYLRSKSFEELYACRPARRLYPTIYQDGAVICENGFGALDDGTYPNKVPMIIGMNKDENKFTLAVSNAFAEDDAFYATAARLSSDLKKAAGCDNVLRRLAANEDQPPVFGYLFRWGAVGTDGAGVMPEPYGFKIGAAHGMEVPFFFGLDEGFASLGKPIFTKENEPGRKALSDAMMGYAAEFAHRGNPGAGGAAHPNWEPWSNETGAPKCIQFDADMNSAQIEVSNEEMTEIGVRERIDSLEESTRDRITKFLERVHP